MPYKIAGIDVHKRMLHVVVSDVQVNGEYDFTRRIFDSLPEALRSLAAWLVEQQVQEVLMESTAQYWKPVWGILERYWKPICQTREGALATSGTLHLAQALSNRGRRGRKKDFRDAERLVKRLVAHELVLSFVPDVEQRLLPSNWTVCSPSPQPPMTKEQAGRVMRFGNFARALDGIEDDL